MKYTTPPKTRHYKLERYHCAKWQFVRSGSEALLLSLIADEPAYIGGEPKEGQFRISNW